MNRYILGTIIALLAYVGASSGQQFIGQLMDEVGNTNAQLSNSSNADQELTPVQRVGLTAQRESDAVPPVSATPNYSPPIADNSTGSVPPSNPDVVGDFPPNTPDQAGTPAPSPVDNSIPALW